MVNERAPDDWNSPVNRRYRMRFAVGVLAVCGAVYGLGLAYDSYREREQKKQTEAHLRILEERHNALPEKIRTYDINRDGFLDHEESKNLGKALEVPESR